MKRSRRLLSEAVVGIALAIGLLVFVTWNNSPTSFEESSPRASLTSNQPILDPSIKIYQPEQAEPGFSVAPESGSATVKLLNMVGKTVHTWKFDAARARLLPNCNLLVVHGTKWGWSQEYWKALRPKVREFDWSGEIVWEYEAPGPAHHDIHRLPNGNTLFLYRSTVPDEFKARIHDPVRRASKIRTDIILEVNPKGETVWEWKAHEHLDLNSCGAYPCKPLPKDMVSGKRTYDWTHINTSSLIPDNDWYAAGDKRFRPGNIMIVPRSWSMAMVIDRQTKEVVWRFVGEHKGGLFGGHDAHMIAKGLPGAGNILIFDNGRNRKESAVLELNPVTQEIVWLYDRGLEFFSKAAGSVQRLPNGNTLISEDVPGRVFEVTRTQEKVWEYHAAMRTARVHRYPRTFCPKLASLPIQ